MHIRRFIRDWLEMACVLVLLGVAVISVILLALFSDKPKLVVLSEDEKSRLSEAQQQQLLQYRQAREDYWYRLRSTPGVDYAPFHEPWSPGIIGAGDGRCEDRVRETRKLCQDAQIPADLL